jgi:type IV fimbrial biogenesis protein FimT
MITVAIVAIVLTVGVPSFSQMIRSNRLTTCTNGFVAALNVARSEAIKRGMRVSVRKTNINWENGWEVFTDNPDVSGSYGTKEGADETLRVYGSLPANYTLRPNNNFANYISFKPNGQSNNMGSFVICDNADANNVPEPNTSRLIIVNMVGRVRLGSDGDQDGIPEKDDGTEINSCTAP